MHNADSLHEVSKACHNLPSVRLKSTPIGMLPEEWDVAALGQITQPNAPIRYGVVQIGPDTPDGVPIVPIKFMNRIDAAPLHRAAKEIEARYVGSRVTGGDILLSVKGTIGRIGVVPKGFRGNIAREIARIRLKAAIDPDFVALQLEAPHTQRRIASSTVGSTRLEFSIAEVRDFMVALPPLPEQRKIAELLRTWDDAIEKLETLRAAKSSRLTALTKLLVFGGRRLAVIETKAAMVAHRWFTLPNDWKCLPINEVAQELSERHTGAKVPEVLSCSKYDGFVRSLEYFKKQVFSTDLDGYKKIWRGDFGFPSNHVEEGSIGLQNLVDVGLVSPIYTVFRFEPTKVLSEYAFAVLKTGLYRHIFAVSTSASVDRRGSLRWTEFAKIPFPLPSMAEQEAIVEVLRTSKTEVTTLDQKIQAITNQKRGLMQKLLTGEWRVSA